MSDVDKFINIFEGSYSAYGQTRKTDEFDAKIIDVLDENGKNL